MYEALKPLGALSIAICWASVLFLVLNWRGDKTMSFSQHAAAHRSAYLMMAIMESIFLPMYLVFIATWFTHTFQLPILFIVLNAITVIGLLIAAWVPDAPGLRNKIHMAVTYPAYISIIIGVLFLVLSETISLFARIFSLAAFLYMLIGSFYLVHEKGKNNFLYFQAAFLASIQLSILFATYVR